MFQFLFLALLCCVALTSAEGEDHYDVLGIAKDATQNQIRRAYRKKAASLHPDRDAGDADLFARVTAAYEVLSDPDSRQVYDDFGEKYVIELD